MTVDLGAVIYGGIFFAALFGKAREHFGKSFALTFCEFIKEFESNVADESRRWHGINQFRSAIKSQEIEVGR